MINTYGITSYNASQNLRNFQKEAKVMALLLISVEGHRTRIGSFFRIPKKGGENTAIVFCPGTINLNGGD